jgi:hypothetical protein
MTRFRVLLLLGLAALGACTGSSSDGPGSASSTATKSGDANESGTAVHGARDTIGVPCPRTGKWALCSVEKRLEQSGFVVRRVSGNAPRRAGFSVVPAAYVLGGSRLEVFIYPSESALSADVAKIDTVSAAPRGTVTPWETSPTFVRSGNLAAVFLTENGTQAERLTLALTAGAPQR